MKRLLILSLTILGGLFMLSGCMGNNLEFHKDKGPKVSIKEYFNGPIKAWGIVQDWRGRVVSQFDVVMVGKWEGDNGVLEEEFTYYDGSKQSRTWKINKISNTEYAGTAGDIIGVANGKLSGNAVNWSYSMDVPVDGSTYRLKFDDWMWLMNDDVLINRTNLKKFGITVAELTIFMQKQESGE